MCNVFELPERSFAFFGGLDAVSNARQPVCGIIDSTGVMTRCLRIGNGGISGFDFAVPTPDFGFLCLARKYNAPGNYNDLVILKFDSLLRVEYTRRIEFGYDAYVYSAVLLPNNQFLLSSASQDLLLFDPADTFISSIHFPDPMYSLYLTMADTSAILTWCMKDNRTGTAHINQNMILTNGHIMFDSTFITRPAATLFTNGHYYYTGTNYSLNQFLRSNPLNSSGCIRQPFIPNHILQTHNIIVDTAVTYLTGQFFNSTKYDTLMKSTASWADSCFVSSTFDFFDEAMVSIFPNPVAAELVTIETPSPSTLHIYEMTGRLLEEIPLDPGSNSMKISQRFRNGMYLFRIQSKQFQKSYKVCITR